MTWIELQQNQTRSLQQPGQGNYPVFGAGFLIQGEKLYFSLGTPNFLNPEKFIDDSSFIQNQNPILYMAAGYSIDLGFFDSTINPYVTSKIIPGFPIK